MGEVSPALPHWHPASRGTTCSGLLLFLTVPGGRAHDLLIWPPERLSDCESWLNEQQNRHFSGADNIDFGSFLIHSVPTSTPFPSPRLSLRWAPCPTLPVAPATFPKLCSALVRSRHGSAPDRRKGTVLTVVQALCHPPPLLSVSRCPFWPSGHSRSSLPGPASSASSVWEVLTSVLSPCIQILPAFHTVMAFEPHKICVH